MTSKDQIIVGVIDYKPVWSSPLGAFNGSASINAKFNFNSINPTDKKEYIGLAKIIKEI